MGFFKDVISFGTKTTKSVNNFVKENAGGIPVVGTLLVTGANIQSKQLDAIDKAIGNVPKKKNPDGSVSEFTTDEIKNIEDAKALKASIQDDEIKNSKKREKIILYSFVGFGAISIGTIVYLIMKKNK